MRYKIKGTEIRSENAAKPATQTCGDLVRWLHSREYTPSALDYGCGKLRYTDHLAERSANIGLLDSKVQLTRIQRIDIEYTSVVEYVKKERSQWRIHMLEEFWNNPSYTYDFILCANVLSAIPCARARAKSLRSMRAALGSNGKILFVNQHTNSYFTEVRKRESTSAHLDGWIAQSRGSASYYGILKKDAVSKLIERYGFSAEEAWVQGQSNYVLASKGKT